MKRAENALAATRQCIVALDTEICEREAHHKRLFTQGEYLLRAIRSACSSLRWAYTHIGFRPVHPGHENWIYVLRKRRERVEDGAEKLRLQTMIAIEAEAARLKALGGARNPFLYTHSFRVWTIPMMLMTHPIGDYDVSDRQDNEHDKNRCMAVQVRQRCHLLLLDSRVDRLVLYKQTDTRLCVMPRVVNYTLMLAVRVVRSVVVLAD